MTDDATDGESAPERDGTTDGSFDAVEEVLRAGYFDGMLRRLQASFPDLAQQAVEDALYVAAERCARRAEPPDNVRAWLFTVARNELRDVVRRKPTRPFDPDDPEQERLLPEWPAAEDEAFPDDTYRAVVKHVESWPVSKMRTVVLLVLQAAHEGEPVTNAQLAELAGEVLGEEMSEDSATTHKSRGLKRLRAEYPQIFPDL